MTENLPEPMTTPFSEELARATFGHIVSQHPNVSHHRRRMGLIYQHVSEGKARIDPADRQKLEDFHADIYRQTWISLGENAVSKGCQALLKPAMACVAADTIDCGPLFLNFIVCAESSRPRDGHSS